MDIEVLCGHAELAPISDLKKHPKNPNRHNLDQIIRLAKLIEYHGFRHPIIVSKQSGLIVAGHGRLEAAIHLGMRLVPVEYQDFDSEDAEYAFLVADNAIAEWSDLDLAAINIELADLGPDFDVDTLGLKSFTIEPMDRLIEEVNRATENDEWVGMPEFEKSDGYINLTFQFKTELERELYVKSHDLKIDKKMNRQWIIYK